MKRFTLIEVVVALGILALSLAGLLHLLSSSQEKISASIDNWNHTHMLMQAAEYVLLQKGNDEKEISIPQEIFDYPDYQPLVTYNEVDEQLPEELKGQTGQVPLIGVKIEIIRHKDKKTVSETIVERFDYEGASL